MADPIRGSAGRNEVQGGRRPRHGARRPYRVEFSLTGEEFELLEAAAGRAGRARGAYAADERGPWQYPFGFLGLWTRLHGCAEPLFESESASRACIEGLCSRRDSNPRYGVEGPESLTGPRLREHTECPRGHGG